MPWLKLKLLQDKALMIHSLGSNLRLEAYLNDGLSSAVLQLQVMVLAGN